MLWWCNQYYHQLSLRSDLEYNEVRVERIITGSAPHYRPAWTPDGGHIVFGVNIIDSGGTDLRSIVDQSWAEDRFDFAYSPAVSPDGSRVAYATFRHRSRNIHNFEIVTSALDGSDYRRLTGNRAEDTNPVWSPDGGHIAFLSTRDSESREFNLYVMSADGSGKRSVAPSVRSSPRPAAWSPDGGRLAFRTREGLIYVVGADGSGVRELGQARGQPAWSPDGRSLAFLRLSQDGLVGLIVAAANGSEERTVFSVSSDSLYQDVWPYGRDYLSDITWSPDGSQVRFVATQLVPSGHDSLREVTGMHAAGADGSGSRMLAELEYPGSTAWSPSDSRIAVHVNRLLLARGYSPGVALYSVASDGSDMRVLARQGARLVAEHSGWQDLSDDIAACSDGRLVSNPRKNLGLVQDCETLIGIRDTLAGENVVLSWSADVPMANWREVGVKGDPPRVRTLASVLGSKKLRGSIPPEVANLTELEALELLSGDLTGAIPPELGNLTKLWSLILYQNYLSGDIPPELGRLRNLERLNLGDNMLSGSIPPQLGNLTSLESLQLEDNRLTGEIPSELGKIVNLKYLSLDDNDLTGCIPPELTAEPHTPVLFCPGGVCEESFSGIPKLRIFTDGLEPC